MKLIQIAKGFHGVRQLAGARAEVELRKLGRVPPITYNNHGSNRAWTDEEYDEAIVMRLRGKSHDEIAAQLGRTRASITKQIGPESPLHGRRAEA